MSESNIIELTKISTCSEFLNFNYGKFAIIKRIRFRPL